MWIAVVNNLPEVILGAVYSTTIFWLGWKARGLRK